MTVLRAPRGEHIEIVGQAFEIGPRGDVEVAIGQHVVGDGRAQLARFSSHDWFLSIDIRTLREGP
ncbi:MAG: hypothetical protein L0H31_01820 [Nocardioidaceae bacterium]|nr:hypothetical protein [Nocardioidaceae bacterium]